MKSITKLQVETVKEVLINKLRETKERIKENNLTKARAKYAKEVNDFKTQLILLNTQKKLLKEQEKKLDNKLEKEFGCRTGMIRTKGYGEPTEKEIREGEIIYNSNYEDKTKYPKEIDTTEKAINKYILELKLGTALMEDMKLLIAKIEKIK